MPIRYEWIRVDNAKYFNIYGQKNPSWTNSKEMQGKKHTKTEDKTAYILQNVSLAFLGSH